MDKEREKKIWGLILILAPFLGIGIKIVSPIYGWEFLLCSLSLSIGCRLFIKNADI